MTSVLDLESARTGESYHDLVQKKRKRNQEYMQSIGLVEAVAEMNSLKAAAAAERKRKRELKKKQDMEARKNVEKRKSPRLSPDGSSPIIATPFHYTPSPPPPKFRLNRINNGEDIDIYSTVEIEDGEEDEAILAEAERSRRGITKIQSDLVSSESSSSSPSSSKKKKCKDVKKSIKSCRPVMLDDNVEKLTNQRILSITSHPTLPIVAVGDKVGCVGIWNSSRPGEQTAFFELANRPIHSLFFNATGTTLTSSSTDGTVRIWDAGSDKWMLLFQSFDRSAEFSSEPGFGIECETSGSFFSSYTTPINENELLLANSAGTVAHFDLRSRAVNYNLSLSSKKINTMSIRQDGHTLAVCGNEKNVKFFDLRKLSKKTTAKKAAVVKEFAFYESKNSINSSFFSPDGAKLLTTSYDDTINIINNPHERSGKINKDLSINHNNQTGKWLSTLHAVWHPTDPRYFSCGAMKQPRCVEVFSADNMKVIARATGDYLSAVCSRVAFHRTLPIIYGANSSGRVTKIDLDLQ